jgi:hypothetical protein
MTVAYDPIAELRKLGYTEREASFLYLVGIHSGYFLRRQFLTFIKREDGAMVQRFLEKSVERQHVYPIEYAAGRHIYHLKSKLIYRLLDREDSQNRRVKGDRQIKARLMQVDYLLDHFGEQFLETPQQKVTFFQEKLKTPLESLPQTRSGKNETPSYFPDRFPVAVQQAPEQSAPLVTSVFIDDGMRSISAFIRWLSSKLRSSAHCIARRSSTPQIIPATSTLHLKADKQVLAGGRNLRSGEGSLVLLVSGPSIPRVHHRFPAVSVARR